MPYHLMANGPMVNISGAMRGYGSMEELSRFLFWKGYYARPTGFGFFWATIWPFAMIRGYFRALRRKALHDCSVLGHE